MPYTGRSHILTLALAILKQVLWPIPTFASSQSYILISAKTVFQQSAKSFSHFDFGASHFRLLLQANPTFSFRCKSFLDFASSHSWLLAQVIRPPRSFLNSDSMHAGHSCSRLLYHAVSWTYSRAHWNCTTAAAENKMYHDDSKATSHDQGSLYSCYSIS